MRWMFYLLLAMNFGYFVGQIMLSGYFQEPVVGPQKRAFSGEVILLASEVQVLEKKTKLVEK